MGLHGAAFIVSPSNFFYTKTLLLINYYSKIFGSLYFQRGIDEVVLYFTVYPAWSKLIKIWTRCMDKYHDKKCPIYHYQIHKPFKASENTINTPRTFKVWDKYAKELIIAYPHFYKYFKHIKDIRNVNY